MVGRTVALNGRPFSVVGVAPEAFRGMSVTASDVWLPASMVDVLSASKEGASRLTSRQSAWLMIGARLEDGVTTGQAQAEIDAINRALQRDHPEGPADGRFRIARSSPIPSGLRLVVAGFVALLMALVSLVLVIACANLASVLLARATSRRREIAVRIAVGAGRARLVRQLLTESLLLFVLGGGGGLALARVLTSVVVWLLPAFPVPVNLSFPLDGRVVAFTLGLSLVAAVLSGLAPALQASKADVVSTLKDDDPWPAGRSRLRHAFVIGQVAFSILLVACAGLLLRALGRTSTFDPGFDPRRIQTASLNLSLGRYTEATGPGFARELLEQVRRLPGVQSATLADRPPLEGRMVLGGLTVPGAAAPEGQRNYDMNWNIVAPGYFSTLGIPVTAGRDFSAADRVGAPPVAILSESAAQRFWPGQNGVGRELVWHPSANERAPAGGGRVVFVPNLPPPTTLAVIGVVRDLKNASGAPSLAVYLPFQQRYTARLTILARTTQGDQLAREIRNAVSSMDPNLPVLTTQSLERQSLRPVELQLRVAASVSGSVGLVGLLLAAIGVYGVTAYAVTRRTREIGIRLAMGAARADVLRMVLRQGMSLVLIGLVVGLVLAAGASRLLTRLLFGLSPLDPVTFSGAAMLFALIGLAACYVPARRATRIDAMEALRYE